MGWMIQGLISGKGKTFPSSLKCPHWAYPASYQWIRRLFQWRDKGTGRERGMWL